MKLRKMWLNINGVNRMFICDPENDSLADVLRRIGLTGTKVGCGTGVCGSCTIILDGKLVRACIRKMRTIEEYSEVITIEGIGTPNNLHPLQIAWMNCGAVQCGFCTPGFIISSYALLLENFDPTRKEIREWFQKNRNVCRCTGYKQIVDAVMAAAKVLRKEATIEDITFQLPEDKEYYGKPLVRPDAIAKVCGLADYGEDQELKMPAETLHAAIVQPKITHHAKILQIDKKEAETMPGVVKIITHKELKKAGGTNIMGETPRMKRTTARLPSQRVFAEDRIRRYGDVVALVVADTKDNARRAAAKVKVEIEQLPEYLTYLDAVHPDAMRIHEDTPNMFTMQPLLKGSGLEDPRNVEKIIDESEFSVSGSFSSQHQPHLSIEGCTVQAYFDEDENLTIHCKSQGVYQSIGRMSNSVYPQDKIRIIMNPTGGSFGWTVAAGDLCLVGAATVVTKMPVALSMSYEEHQHFSGKRTASYSNGRLACDKDGKITAVEYDIGLDHGAYSQGDYLVGKLAEFPFNVYNVPNISALGRMANTNHNFGIAYRSFGSPQSTTMSEALVDMLAEKAGIDPFEFRWLNIARPGDTSINSYPLPKYVMEEIMNKMRPHYKKALKKAKDEDTPQKRRGVGLSMGGFPVTLGANDSSTVAIEIAKDNKFIKYDTYQKVGQGGDIGSLTLTLEALKPLGVKPEQIRLIQNDTKLCPDSGISAASRSHHMSGNATILAAEKLMNAMRKEDGSYRTYEEMVAEGIDTKYEAKYENSVIPGLKPLDQNTGIGNPTASRIYGFNLAEVEVDTVTGETKVIGYTTVAYVGKIGNIDAVNGQAYGGISHCIGFALSEDYSDMKKHSNMYGAGIPYIKDIPDEINVIYIDKEDEHGPFGSTGCSEIFQANGHMAVINAINDACGVRIYELPATKEKVKLGLDIIASGNKIGPAKKYFLGSDLYEELEYIKKNPV